MDDSKRVFTDPALSPPTRRDPPWPPGHEPWTIPNYDLRSASDALLADITRFNLGVGAGAQAELAKRVIEAQVALRTSIDSLKRSTDRAAVWTIALTVALVLLTAVLVGEGIASWLGHRP